MEYKNIKVNKVPLLEVSNSVGMKVHFSGSGAGVVSIKLDGKPMTVSPIVPTNFLVRNHYYGKIIGPIAGLVIDGKVMIEDNDYHLELNHGKDTLHNGTYSLSNIRFSSRAYFGREAFSILYSFKKKKMKDGLPGNIQYFISYTIADQKNEMMIDIRAISDDKTPMLLTSNNCFCLGEENINNLKLEIPSERFINISPDDLTYLEEKDVNKEMDFQKMKNLQRDIHAESLSKGKINGYDHYYKLRKEQIPIKLEGSKYGLEIISNFEGVHIYTGNDINEIKSTNSLEKSRRGIVIAPMDNPLQIPLMEKSIPYHKQILYKFYRK